MDVVASSAGADRAVARPEIPLGAMATRVASPPPAGSRHTAGLSPLSGLSAPPLLSLLSSWPSFCAAAGPAGWAGAGRLDRNSSEPSGRKAGLLSPAELCVSRDAAAPAGSAATRQMLLVNLVPAASSVDTETASQLPSGDSARVLSLGIRMNSRGSSNGGTW